MAEFTDEVKTMIWAAAHTTRAVDVRVFANPPGLTHPGVSGIDALLTTPEVLAEFFRRRALSLPGGTTDPAAVAAHEAYIQSLTPSELADIVWRQLFVDHSPLSEPCRITLTSMGLLGLDVGAGDLRLLREQYQAIPEEERLEKVLALANLELILYPVESMTVDAHLSAGVRTPIFRPVLHLTDLLGEWKESARQLRLQGYGLKAKVDEYTPLELRRHLASEIVKLSPVALAIDWPEGVRPDDNQIGRLVRDAVLPLCREKKLALFIASGDAPVEMLSPLWRENPGVRFLLSPGLEEQFSAAILAAANARNLLLCGPDQPLSYPFTQTSFLARSLEALGSAFHACHSGADVAEELTGCWAHLRWTLGKTLIQHYMDMWRTGWHYKESDIHKDVKAILGGNVRSFLSL